MNGRELEDAIIQIIHAELPGKKIKIVEDKGVWVKHIFKVVFNDDSFVYFKLAVKDFSNVILESNVVKFLKKNGIYQPRVIKADASGKALPYPYIIQEGGTGKPLSYYLKRSDTEQLKRVYNAVGRYYSKFAGIANDWAGVWDVVPNKKLYPLHPAEAMYQLEIEQGSGYKAYSMGAITPEQYERIKTVWQRSIPWLKKRPVHLVHYSPFPWAIYISEEEGDYEISKITAFDIVWWDADIMAAHVMYPPFFNINDELRNEFLSGFNREIDIRCISLYSIMHRLCAWAGTYSEPDFDSNEIWRNSCLSDINFFLGNLE